MPPGIRSTSGGRVGPRGITIDQVAQVGARGSAAMPSTATSRGRMPSPYLTTAAPRIPTETLLADFIGEPSPTYGKKYGGFPTLSQLQDAVSGALMPIGALEALAAQQAETERARAIQRRSDRLESIYGPSGADIDVTRPGYQQQLAEATGYEEGPGGRPRPLQYTRGIENEPEVQAVLRQTGGWSPMTQRAAEFGPDAIGRDMMQQYINALTPQPSASSTAALRAPAPGDGGDAAALALATRNAVSRRRAEELASNIAYEQDIARAVTPSETAAAELANLPREELAQQLAVSRFGIDPSLAAGIFTPEWGRQQRLMEFGAQGVFPGQSIEETILFSEGPDALAEFQQRKADAALAKQYDDLQSEEDMALDLQIETETGIPVDAAAGDYDKATARQYLTDPNFIDIVQQGQQQLLSSNFTSLEEQNNLARSIAKTYYSQVGDPIAAEILQNVLASFDFSLAYAPLEG